MLDAAERKGICHAVGLQGQMSPAINYTKDVEPSLGGEMVLYYSLIMLIPSHYHFVSVTFVRQRTLAALASQNRPREEPDIRVRHVLQTDAASRNCNLSAVGTRSPFRKPSKGGHLDLKVAD